MGFTGAYQEISKTGRKSPPMESRGKAPVGGLGTKSPEAEVYNI